MKRIHGALAIVVLITVVASAVGVPLLVPSVAPAAGPRTGTSGSSGSPPVAAPPHLGGAVADLRSAAAVVTQVPGAGSIGSMVYDSAKGYVVLVVPNGTISLTSRSALETWVYGSASGNWTEVHPIASPPTRVYSALVYDDALKAVVLFGGIGPTGAFLNDTWTFDGSTWTNATPSGPSPSGRADAQFAMDDALGVAILFGGYGTTSTRILGNLSDTWGFSGTWTVETSALAPPVGGATAYDAALGLVVHYGGSPAPNTCSNATFTFGSAGWTNVTGLVRGDPGRLSLASVAYDSDAGRLILFGGACPAAPKGAVTTAVNATWSFDGTAWTALAASRAPSPRFGAALAYIPPWNATLLFGGTTPSNGGGSGGASSLDVDTYLFANGNWSQIAPVIVRTASVADTGQSFNLSVAGIVSGGTPMVSYSGLPSGCSILFLLTIVCKLLQSTVLNVTATATSSFALAPAVTTSAVATATTVVTVNAAPRIVAVTVSPSEAEIGVPVAVRATVLGGTGALLYTYSNLPIGCPSGGVANLTCTPTEAGTFDVTLVAVDALGVSANGTATLSVAVHPSVRSLALSRSTIDAGMEVNASIDLSGGVAPFSFVYSGLPAGCSGSNATAITCRPTGGVTGSFNVSVAARDRFGFTATGSELLRINPAPAIASFSSDHVTVDVNGSATFSVVVAGGTPPFAFRYTGLPNGCSTENTSSLTCLPTVAGNFTVVVTATDSVGGSASSTTRLSVDVVRTSPRGPPGGGGGFLGFGPGSVGTFLQGLAVAAVLVLLAGSIATVALRGRAIERRRLADELSAGVARHATELPDDPTPSDPSSPR